MDIQKFYNRAYDWVFAFGPRTIIAIVVLIAGLSFIRLLRKWIWKALNKKFASSGLVPFVAGICVTILHVLLVLLVLQILGIQMTLFAALIAALGVAAGLALSGTLQNITGGILLLILKPFRQGDNIITQGQEGTVTSIQIFYTVVTTFDNRTVIVPNSKLSNDVIINTSREGTRRIDIELKFNYGISFDNIRSIVEKSIARGKDILDDPKYRISIFSLDPDGFKVMIQVWTKSHGFQDTRNFLMEKVIEDLKANNIKLPGM